MEGRTQMLTLYSDQHHDHAPQVEYLHGKTISYAEQPQRIENIRMAVEASGLVKLQRNIPTLPRQALLKASDEGIINFLENVGEFIHRVMDSPSTAYQTSADQQYMYPSVFPIRPFMNRLQHNAHGPNGFYFFDTEAPVGKTTWNAVLASASLAYAGAEMILAGHKSAYALCRPPGHHAGADFMGGYCYINNAAVAAHHLRQMGRVTILDIDYHHGNGTQDAFWTDEQVGFFSVHRWPFYPGTGSRDEVGAGKGIGATLNLPITFGTPRPEYMAAFTRDVTAFAAKIKPQLVMISAGFDSHRQDPIGSLGLEVEDFTELTQIVLGIASEYAGGHVVSVLEGGYNLDVLPLGRQVGVLDRLLMADRLVAVWLRVSRVAADAADQERDARRLSGLGVRRIGTQLGGGLEAHALVRRNQRAAGARAPVVARVHPVHAGPHVSSEPQVGLVRVAVARTAGASGARLAVLVDVGGDESGVLAVTHVTAGRELVGDVEATLERANLDAFSAGARATGHTAEETRSSSDQ